MTKRKNESRVPLENDYRRDAYHSNGCDSNEPLAVSGFRSQKGESASLTELLSPGDPRCSHFSGSQLGCVKADGAHRRQQKARSIKTVSLSLSRSLSPFIALFLSRAPSLSHSLSDQ